MGEKGRPWGLPFWFGGSRERLCRIGRWSGFGPAQVQTCEVGSRPVPGGGSRLSLEKARTQRVAGEGPRPPFFLWPARSHSLVLAWWGAAGRWWGYYGAHVRALIWKLSFAKMLSSIFSLENASQIGLGIPEETAPLSYQRQRSPKRANGSERAMNPGVQGLAPGVLSPDFLPKKVGLPRRSRRGTHVAGSTLQRFQRNRLSMTEGPRALTSDRDGPAPRWPGPPGPRRPPPGPGPG